MELSESEVYEAGLLLPPAARLQVAQRLAESVASTDTLDAAAEHWLQNEAAQAYDALQADPTRAVPVDEVRERIERKWAARA